MIHHFRSFGPSFSPKRWNKSPKQKPPIQLLGRRLQFSPGHTDLAVLYGMILPAVIYGDFLKMVGETPTNGKTPTKTDHFWGVKWGYHHLRKHPYGMILQQSFGKHPHIDPNTFWGGIFSPPKHLVRFGFFRGFQTSSGIWRILDF